MAFGRWGRYGHLSNHAIRGDRPLSADGWVRRWLLALPALSVAFFAFVWFGWLGVAESVRAVRVYGGTLPSTRIALRAVLVSEQAETAEQLSFEQLTLRLVDARGEQQVVTSKVDDHGVAAFNAELSLSAPPFDFQVLSGRDSLAAGSWQAGSLLVRRRGGWARGTSRGAWEVRVGVLGGVLAAGSLGRLVVEVTERGRPVSGARVEASFEGAQPEPAETGRRFTRDDGRLFYSIRPLGHTVLARVLATPDATSPADQVAVAREGSWYGELPLVPGALPIAKVPSTSGTQATLELSAIAPIPVIYVHLVRNHEVLWTEAVSPSSAFRGVHGSLTLPDGLGTWDDVFAVTASDPERFSDAVVGWPLFETTEPVSSYDAQLRLIADGFEAALGKRETEQRRVAGYGALVLASLCAGELGGFFWLFWGERRRRPLRQVPQSMRFGFSTMAWAALCIGLSFAGLASLLWVALR